MVVYQGNQGGIELGFEYRARLTGLASDEAEALAVILARPIAELDELGMADAAHRARAKIMEAFPEQTRAAMEVARDRFRFDRQHKVRSDPRVAALAKAIRGSNIVRIAPPAGAPRDIHPVGLTLGPTGWRVIDARSHVEPVPLDQCGDINVSARTFASTSQIKRKRTKAGPP